MAVAIRTPSEIERIRQAGQIVGHILKRLEKHAVEGMTTAELAEISDRMIAEADAIPLFKGVHNPQAKFDFPASICVSINEQVVHGIPGGRKLRNGDIVSIDCGVKYNGYCGDAAITVIVGQTDPDVRRLVEMTKTVLDVAVRESSSGVLWSHVAGMMQKKAEQAGFGVVRDYVGHGIGRQMHEDPKLPNFVSQDLLRNDLQLRKGMILAVEPMVNMGTWKVKVLDDGWTVVTADGKPAAHFEHTIAVTDQDAEILTEWNGES